MNLQVLSAEDVALFPVECLPWQKSKTPDGYGVMWVSRLRKLAYAHRVMWEYWIGPIPDGVHVLHRCDNPPCVNPGHLFLGTNSDNIQDRMRKGRSRVGEKSPASKLTELQAKEILTLYAQGIAQKDIAIRFGMSRPAIHALVHGKLWKHLHKGDRT